MSNQVVGGWSPYRKPTAEDLAVFNEAIKGLIGVKYTPELVSTQVVAGMNYKFICIAEPSTVEPLQYKATVQIYAPLDAKPYVTHITPH
jgi:hypothetical protein